MRFDCSDPQVMMMAVEYAVMTGKCPECLAEMVWTEEADGDYIDIQGECPKCKWGCAYGGLDHEVAGCSYPG